MIKEMDLILITYPYAAHCTKCHHYEKEYEAYQDNIQKWFVHFFRLIFLIFFAIEFSN